MQKKNPMLRLNRPDSLFFLLVLALCASANAVFADVPPPFVVHSQPDQARIVALNAHLFLKNEGHCVILVKANCIDSTAPAEHVFAQEVNKLKAEQVRVRAWHACERGSSVRACKRQSVGA